MTKKAGSGSKSGSISQRHGSADLDPDPPQNVLDPQHCTVGIPILLGGISDPFLVRSLFELEGWLRGTGIPYPQQSWALVLQTILECKTNVTQEALKNKTRLPVSEIGAGAKSYHVGE